MIKRLLLSLMILAAVGATLSFGAVAYFKDANPGGVTITAGDADLNLDWDDNCDGTYEATGLNSFSMVWNHIVPNDTETDCVRINNAKDGALDVYVHNGSFTGNTALRHALKFRVRLKSDGSVLCSYANADAAQYTSDNAGKGCMLVDELASGSNLKVYLDSKFVDDGSDQTSLENKQTGWTTSVDGYTD
jgi:hypothetical protein